MRGNPNSANQNQHLCISHSGASSASIGYIGLRFFGSLYGGKGCCGKGQVILLPPMEYHAIRHQECCCAQHQ
jgi:hypothetical protein